MRGRANLSMVVAGAVLILAFASFVSPEARVRVIGFAVDCVDALREFKDFVVELFRLA